MNKKFWQVFAGVCAIAVCGLGAVPASAQMQEVKEKPRMYSYVAFWTYPRPQWAEAEKQVASEQKLLEKAVADGTIVGYGDDKNLIHQVDGQTHDTWFSAMSMAGLLNLLDQIYKAGIPTAPVDATATRHWDAIYVTHFYNWHPGSWKDVYTAGGMYRLKHDAPREAIEILSKTLFVPLLEKLLADGSIHEYEIDTEAIHTENPDTFWIEYVAANAEAIDKVNAAVREAQRGNPLGGQAFESMVDFKEHRDSLSRTNATYK
jgi:hypothetical protein